VICGLLFVLTLFSVNITTFSVATLTNAQMSSMDLEQTLKVAGKSLPTAASICATVAAQEVARRVAAGKYGVDLTPPFFIPVWPLPSIGCFGAVSRRLGTVPNNEAALGMSAAAQLSGFIVSSLILLYGLSQGPDPDKIVNLNFQLLPLVLKLVLKPFLGQTSVSDQPDPFADPVSIAFPSNPLVVGGIIGLIITSLNLLPIGRLDGGSILKAMIGQRNGGLVGFLALAILFYGTLAPNEAGTLPLTFSLFAVLFQNGSETPARDTVTEIDPSLRLLGYFLVVTGTVLSIPGNLLPGI